MICTLANLLFTLKPVAADRNLTGYQDSLGANTQASYHERLLLLSVTTFSKHKVLLETEYFAMTQHRTTQCTHLLFELR